MFARLTAGAAVAAARSFCALASTKAFCRADETEVEAELARM
jgi:hypothetical protein